MTTLTVPQAKAAGTSVADVAAIHDQLRELYKDVAPADMTTDAETEALMAFNGYYALGNGNFFTVDTNMIVKGTAIAHHITLILFLEGNTPNIFSFNGSGATFKNNVLSLNPISTLDIPNLNLTFERGDTSANLVSASLHGTVQLPGHPPQTVTGTTYNNPIPMDMYSGTYYDNKGAVGANAILKIDGNALSYNYTSPLEPGSLESVKDFIYNQNMYFFSFSKTYVNKAGQSSTFKYSCIMGTSAAGGKVCNDVVVEDIADVPTKDKALDVPIPRMLQTIRSSKDMTVLNKQSEALAQFSGFYNLEPGFDIAEGAFVSVEGSYTITPSTPGAKPLWKVQLGLSVDGVKSEVFVFDTTMTFDPATNTLTIPANYNREHELTLTFKREYEADTQHAGFGTLASITGTYNNKPVSGKNYLNPVPLTGFGGAKMTSPPPAKGQKQQHNSLTIESDYEVTWNGDTITEMIYVPLMYIAAFNDSAGNGVELSLGTDGGRGNCCLTTTTTAAGSSLVMVYANPTASAAQH